MAASPHACSQFLWDLTVEADVQGGKTFCASFCASLIAGSRRAFLCVDQTEFDCVCLSLREFWLRRNETHEVWMFASRKAFLPLCGFCCSSLENYFGLRTTDVKAKRIIPSVWGGIKSFEHFQRGEYFSDCALDFIFVSWFRLLSPGWIKNRLYSVYLVNTFSHAQIYSLCRTSFILLFSQVKEPFVRRKTFSEIERQL